ncbi:hypothetical protein EG349_01075 [Chryseobacterium shandongense]|uniref:PDZ domain-containing protein n=1 Tax=Chryseobacterium shandongense TaxID=1493872 RepID=A0AAD0YBW2_9FLAO|nr:aspartyl protease family protein [Chryseobacterium shandongense]AZA85479.1 hypothetical protein EG349_01075 [Chryseobacterium shandongense]AZA97586.1 hypothetical protein EG353_19545 [Chryseobacterium shandongense]
MKLKFNFLIFISAINIYAQQIKLPFELSKDSKAIFIKLPMENQKDSLLYFFDTGAGTTLLDKKTAEKYGLKANYQTEVTGAGGKKLYDVMTNEKIFLDRSEFVDSINIVLDDLARLNTFYEKKFDGIIGASILTNYLTSIDFEANTMTLYQFDDYLNYDGYEKISFEFFSGIPKIPLTFELRNNEKFSGDILFDSGARLTLLVNTPYQEKNKLADKIDEKSLYSSRNLSNNTNYIKGLIKSIQLGNTIIKNKNLAVSLASDKQGVSSLDNLLGILGSEIINRFNFIIDYKNKYLYLKPNNLFDNDFEKLFKPLSFEFSDERKEILISNILVNSDAYKKGLRKGHKIISINNVIGKDIYTYDQMLQSNKRKIVIRYIDSDNQVKSVKIKLRK